MQVMLRCDGLYMFLSLYGCMNSRKLGLAVLPKLQTPFSCGTDQLEGATTCIKIRCCTEPKLDLKLDILTSNV